MAVKQHRREFRKARTMLRTARKDGKVAMVSQQFEAEMKRLGYTFDPWKKTWVRGKSLG